MSYRPIWVDPVPKSAVPGPVEHTAHAGIVSTPPHYPRNILICILATVSTHRNIILNPITADLA